MPRSGAGRRGRRGVLPGARGWPEGRRAAGCEDLGGQAREPGGLEDSRYPAPSPHQICQENLMRLMVLREGVAGGGNFWETSGRGEEGAGASRPVMSLRSLFPQFFSRFCYPLPPPPTNPMKHIGLLEKTRWGQGGGRWGQGAQSAANWLRGTGTRHFINPCTFFGGPNSRLSTVPHSRACWLLGFRNPATSSISVAET